MVRKIEIMKCIFRKHDWVIFELYEKLTHPTPLGQIIQCPARRCKRCGKAERVM